MKKKKNVRSHETYRKGGKSKGVDRERDAKVNEDSKAYGNDISWYVNNPQMLIDACNLSFANVLSKPILVETRTKGDQMCDDYIGTPGVMTLSLIPTIGSVLFNGEYSTGDQWDSAVNMAARAEWSYIRQKNAGAKNYDAPDLMMYHLAMDSIYMYWSWMVRLYGYMRTYSFKNKYYPYGILRAMGMNDRSIESLRGSLADFRSYINLFAAQMSSFAVPINLPYVKRHLWLFQNAFMDASTTKAQVYLYNPAWLYRLNEVTDEPMSLEKIDMPVFNGTVVNGALKAIAQVGDTLISQIVKSESANIMSGDILKAYEASGIYGFEAIPDEFSLAPVYDETVLSQIHNATVIPVDLDATSYIAQDANVDAGYIYQVISGLDEYNEFIVGRNCMVDSRFEAPTPTDVMYATRLTTVVDPDDPKYLNCGSEICVGISIWTDATNEHKVLGIGYTTATTAFQDLVKQTAQIEGGGVYTMLNADWVLNMFQFVSDITKFDWHPLVKISSYWAHQRGESEIFPPHARYEDYKSFYFGDLDNFTVVQGQTIGKIHKVALNSEFGLPYTLTSVK